MKKFFFIIIISLTVNIYAQPDYKQIHRQALVGGPLAPAAAVIRERCLGTVRRELAGPAPWILEPGRVERHRAGLVSVRRDAPGERALDVVEGREVAELLLDQLVDDRRPRLRLDAVVESRRQSRHCHDRGHAHLCLEVDDEKLGDRLIEMAFDNNTVIASLFFPKPVGALTPGAFADPAGAA